MGTKITTIDTDGVKNRSLNRAEFGYDDFTDVGRVYIGTAVGTDIPLAKLSEVEDLQVATTPNALLTAIKTVDGSGSGLDADTLDGTEASSFIQTSDIGVIVQPYSEAIATDTVTPINISATLDGSFSIVGTDLVATDVIGSISNGYSASGSIVNNERFTLDGIITPTNGQQDGYNYYKTTASGTVTSTLIKPLFGEVSVVGDYYLNGLLYDSSGIVYNPQQTYLSENGKLLKVTASGGVPNTITLEDDAPSIIEKCIQSDVVIAQDVKVSGKFIGKNAITAFVNFEGTTALIKDFYNFSSVVWSGSSSNGFVLTFETPMDNENYTISSMLEDNLASIINGLSYKNKTVNGFNLTMRDTNSYRPQSAFLDISIQIIGGKD